jgi:hypothetical protein
LALRYEGLARTPKLEVDGKPSMFGERKGGAAKLGIQSGPLVPVYDTEYDHQDSFWIHEFEKIEKYMVTVGSKDGWLLRKHLYGKTVTKYYIHVATQLVFKGQPNPVAPP